MSHSKFWRSSVLVRKTADLVISYHHTSVANSLILDEFQDFSLFQWMGETPKRLVQDHLFQHDPKSGEKFAKVVESAKKDVIKSQYEKSPGLQSKADL
jgi:hypothetical protein